MEKGRELGGGREERGGGEEWRKKRERGRQRQREGNREKKPKKMKGREIILPSVLSVFFQDVRTIS